MKWILVILGLVLAVGVYNYEPRIDTLTKEDFPPVDHRPVHLKRFFEKYKCPEPYYIDEYLNAADKYQLPYQLLPAISVIESSCGRHYRYSNYWGWNSARSGFNSIPEGIDFVTHQLAEGKYYAGKTVEQKLKTYNPPSVNPAYAPTVIRLINEIEPL